MSTTGIDESEGQCPSTLYLYLRHLFLSLQGPTCAPGVASTPTNEVVDIWYEE